MRLIATSLILVTMLGLFSCGPKRPDAGQVDAFMESLSLRLNMTKDNYLRFTSALPQEQSIIAGSMTQTVLDLSLKNMKEERALTGKCKPFEADEDTKAKSEALKQAAIAIIDTYIDGAEKEMQDVAAMIKKGKTSQSPEVAEALGRFETRLNAKYEAYSGIQAELAKAYNITLY